MFDKKYEDRLRAWADFRSQLELSHNPLQDAIDFYIRVPLVNIQVDPYDQDSWLDPWSLLYENKYCEFAIILGIAYSLQLTTRFSSTQFEIHICTNKEMSEVKYLLYIDNDVIGYHRDRSVAADSIPKNLKIEKKYCLPPLQ
jgi:hypothetical protein